MERSTPPRALRPRRRRIRRVLRILLALLLIGVAASAGIIYRLSRPFVTPGSGIRHQVREVYDAAIQPRQAFPGKDYLYILGLGIDANYTSQGIMFTKNARSDTIFVASLDLEKKRVGMLSIPRDTRVELADGSGTSKINAAHARGGVPLAKSTVEQFLGINLDHYIVIKMYGTRHMVDAMGGIVVDVEKDMDYDDNWGNLHIHLKKGRQRLTGEQAVGYIRFRHDIESDFGRMRRQQQLVKAMAAQMMTPSTLLRLDRLVDTAMENIETDMSRAQLLALAHLFHNVPPQHIYTDTLAGYDFRGSDGAWYFDASESKKEALVGWLLRGEEWYRKGLITIRIHNASGVTGAGGIVRDILSDMGYHVILGRPLSGPPQATTRVVDVMGRKEDAQQVADLFPNTEIAQPAAEDRPEPGGPDMVVYVGKDCAGALAHPAQARSGG